MKDLEFRLWCSKIIDLSIDQGKQALALMSIKGHKGEDLTAVPFQDEDWLLPGINQALMSRGLLTKMSETFGRRGPIFVKYQKIGKDVRDELERILRTQLGRKIRSSEYIIYGLTVGNAMIDWCEKRNMSPARGVILVNVTHCIEALEESFPGYIASGMLPAAIGGFQNAQVNQATKVVRS